MSLRFDEEITEEISFISALPEKILIDFCKLAIDYTENGTHNTKKYNIAAQKLDCPVEKIENAVTSIIKVLIEATRYSISDAEFSNSVRSLGFEENQAAILQKLYEAKKPHISNFIPRISFQPVRFFGIDWRAEAQFTSRFEPNVVKPYVVLDIITKQDAFFTADEISAKVDSVKSSKQTVLEVYNEIKQQDVIKHHILKCDIPNLINMINTLKTAWRESHASHVRKMEYAITRKDLPTETPKKTEEH